MAYLIVAPAEHIFTGIYCDGHLCLPLPYLSIDGNEMSAKHVVARWLIPTLALMMSVSVVADEKPSLETLAVQVPAEYETPESIPDKVRNECVKLPELLAQGVAKALGDEGYANIRTVSDASAMPHGKFLSLKIVNVNATPGGVWSGAKSLSVRANLYQSNKLVSWRVFTRRSSSAMHGYGNCNVLAHDADVIGSDVYRWLVKSMRSRTLPVNLPGYVADSEDQMESEEPDDGQLPPASSSTLLISTRADYAEPDEIPLKIFTECHLDTTLGSHMMTLFTQRIPTVLPLDDSTPSDGQLVLKYEILTAAGHPGSRITGRKTLAIRATLSRGGAIIDTFDDTYVSKDPTSQYILDPTTMYRNGGTCDALYAGAKTLAAHALK